MVNDERVLPSGGARVVRSPPRMNKARLEAFSDGVLAIIITIMVLELKVPHGTDLEAIQPLLPVLASYVLSFVFVGIYWNNHHHLLHIAKRVTGGIMWANLHLLFWLSLVPFVTGWVGEHHGAQLPTALYGVVLLMAALAYTILQRMILAHHPRESDVVEVLRRDRKGWISLLAYLASIPLAYVYRPASWGLFVFVALVWLIPDRRIESVLSAHGAPSPERDPHGQR
jgi:uncharacterized membrane protein